MTLKNKIIIRDNVVDEKKNKAANAIQIDIENDKTEFDNII